MKQAQTELSRQTDGPGLYEVTREVCDWSLEQGIACGLLTVFVRHTSASLLIQENADPDVLADLNDAYARLAPEGAHYRHDSEGPDDMPAHIRAALSQSQLSIPVGDSLPLLGTWQGIFLFEHRHRPHRRKLVLHLVGE